MDFITTTETAELLGIRYESVARLIRQGVLDGRKFGHVWMVERESAEAYKLAIAGKHPQDPTKHAGLS